MTRIMLLLILAIPAAGAAEPQWTRAALEHRADLAAEKYGVPPALIKAVCRIESAWQPSAIGDDGRSIGLCQIQIDTGLALYGKLWRQDESEVERRAEMKKNLLNPSINISLAAILLRKYMDRFDGDETLAVMAYNGGPENKMIRHLLRFRSAREIYAP